jgi:hypothetical protein
MSDTPFITYEIIKSSKFLSIMIHLAANSMGVKCASKQLNNVSALALPVLVWGAVDVAMLRDR